MAFSMSPVTGKASQREVSREAQTNVGVLVFGHKEPMAKHLIDSDSSSVQLRDLDLSRSLIVDVVPLLPSSAQVVRIHRLGGRQAGTSRGRGGEE
jgi:hypothetical protein